MEGTTGNLSTMVYAEKSANRNCFDNSNENPKRCVAHAQGRLTIWVAVDDSQGGVKIDGNTDECNYQTIYRDIVKMKL